MTEYTLHTFINDLKQEDNNTGQARLEDFHHAGDGPDGPDGPLWMLPADCGNRRAEVVVSLLRTGPVEMGDNIRPMLMLPGVVWGGGWWFVSHILMPASKYLHSLLSHNVLYSFSFEER